jgi:hypothetical protein
MEAEPPGTQEQDIPVGTAEALGTKESFGNVGSWWSTLTPQEQVLFILACIVVLFILAKKFF